MRFLGIWQLFVIILPILSGCDGYDSKYFPYGMKGLNVLVINNATQEEYFGGFVEGSYFSRKEAVSSCADRAGTTARQHHLIDWSYVCCTVTSSSNCRTKVR
jgi:hypothetical protein